MRLLWLLFLAFTLLVFDCLDLEFQLFEGIVEFALGFECALGSRFALLVDFGSYVLLDLAAERFHFQLFLFKAVSKRLVLFFELYLLLLQVGYLFFQSDILFEKFTILLSYILNLLI
jgi:hypothetical protein